MLTVGVGIGVRVRVGVLVGAGVLLGTGVTTMTCGVATGASGSHPKSSKNDSSMSGVRRRLMVRMMGYYRS